MQETEISLNEIVNTLSKWRNDAIENLRDAEDRKAEIDEWYYFGRTTTLKRVIDLLSKDLF